MASCCPMGRVLLCACGAPNEQLQGLLIYPKYPSCSTATEALFAVCILFFGQKISGFGLGFLFYLQHRLFVCVGLLTVDVVLTVAVWCVHKCGCKVV